MKLPDVNQPIFELGQSYWCISC